MGRDGIVERIRKLLALADEQGGGTDAERANAAERAQALMLKHQIEEHELANAAGRDALPGVERVDLGGFGRSEFWRISLLSSVGQLVTVDAIYVSIGGRRRAWLVGRPDSIAYVRLLHDWLVPQLQRDCERSLAEAKVARGGMDSRAAFVFRRTFYDHAVFELRGRLEAAHQRAVDESGRAGAELVRSDRAAVDAFYGDDAPKEAKARARAQDPLAAISGAHAGQAADIDPRNKVDAGVRRELGVSAS